MKTGNLQFRIESLNHRIIESLDHPHPNPLLAYRERGQNRKKRRGFTLAEVMCSLMIFAMVATAGTYMMGAMANSQTYFRNGTSSQSEVEFALGRIVENVRAASAVSTPSSTSASSSLSLTTLSGSTISYQVTNGNLVEVSSVGGTSTTSTLVHGATFSAAESSGNAKAFSITVSAGTGETISRTVTVFGRNL